MLQAAPISTQALADVINQSVDCVKLVNTAGDVLWMNANGLCAMEIDDHTAIYGRRWSDLWPQENRQTVNDALAQAQSGDPVRFEAFCPTAKGSPRWWNVTVTAVTAPDGADIGYLAISRDVTEGETQRRALGIAADELRHRLKNTYAMVCGMLNTFALGNSEHEAFARAMNARLMALGTAQSFFMGPDMPRDVKALLPALIQPFADARCTLGLDGVETVLVPRAVADAVALIIVELAMNSDKNGAIHHGGAIEVTARADGDGNLRLAWHETANQEVTSRRREGGQGLDLIAMMVEAHRGSITTRWESHGPVVEAQLPIMQ